MQTAENGNIEPKRTIAAGCPCYGNAQKADFAEFSGWPTGDDKRQAFTLQRLPPFEIFDDPAPEPTTVVSASGLSLLAAAELVS